MKNSNMQYENNDVDNMINIAVVGSDGFIGRHIVKALNSHPKITVISIGRKKDVNYYLELTTPDDFDYSVLNDIDFIIFLAAVVNQDKCAYEYEYCRKVMVVGTSFFIEKALEHDCKVLFFSSDAVYDFNPRVSYSEESITNPITAYGKLKDEVEKIFFNGGVNFRAVRLSYVISRDDKFVSYCLNCIENAEVADIFHPFYRNCITVGDVIQMVFWMVWNWKEYPFKKLNLVGDELVSRVRIADEINRLYGGCLKYRIIYPGKEFFQNRPMIMDIKSQYLHKYEIIEELTFSEKVRLELDNVFFS